MNMMRVNERHNSTISHECGAYVVQTMRQFDVAKFSIKITLIENDTAHRPYYFIKQKDFPHFPRLMIFDAVVCRLYQWMLLTL